ncbi:MAG: HEAT repeat domain-containing protein [Armatimonadota bacterium]
MTNTPSPKDELHSGTMDQVPHLDLLLHELHSENPTVRTWAAIQLGQLGDQQAVPALIEALHDDDDEDVRCEVVTTLGELRDPRALPALFSVMNEPRDESYSPDYNTYAALLQMPSEALAHLLDELRDHNPDVRKQYAGNLFDHCFYLCRTNALSRENVERVIPEHIRELVLPVLLQASQDSCSEVRAAVLGTLYLFDEEDNDQCITDVLIAGLSDEDEDVRCTASIKINSRITSPFQLHDQLHDPRPEVRVAALNAIEFVDGNLNPLLEALEDPVPIVSLKALTLLLKKEQQALVSEDILNRLLHAVYKRVHDPDPMIRAKALHCLREAKALNLRDEVMAALNDEASIVRYSAIIEIDISRWDDDAVYHALHRLYHDDDPLIRRRVIRALRNISHPGVSDIFLNALNDTDEIVAKFARIFIMRVLAKDKLHDFAMSALHSESEHMRWLALRCIVESDYPQRIDLLKAALSDPDPHTRSVAVDGLLQLDNRQILDELLPMLDDPNSWIRLSLLGALVRMNDTRDIPLIIPHIRDKNRQVRAFALDILRRVTNQDFGTDINRWQQWWQCSAAQ